MNKRRIDEIGIRYVESLKLYEEYAARIRNLIQDLVEVEGVEFYAIDGWAEPPAELLRILSTLEENDLPGVDLVTIRVLLRFPADVLRIESLIKSEFDVDPSRSLPQIHESSKTPADSAILLSFTFSRCQNHVQLSKNGRSIKTSISASNSVHSSKRHGQR